MYRPVQQIVLGAVTLLSVIAGNTPAYADHYRDINRSARRIDSNAAAIVRQARHLSSSPFYHGLVQDTLEMQRLADHVREIARNGCDLYHLQSDVISLGNAYRVLERRINQVERLTPACHNIRRIRKMVDAIQNDIRSILVNLNQLLAPDTCPLETQRSGHSINPGWGAFHTQFGFPYAAHGTAGSFPHGVSPHGNLSRGHQNSFGYGGAEVRYSGIANKQNQGLQRSAELDRQLRERRVTIDPRFGSMPIGGGGARLTFNF